MKKKLSRTKSDKRASIRRSVGCATSTLLSVDKSKCKDVFAKYLKFISSFNCVRRDTITHFVKDCVNNFTCLTLL